jgi:hypothetical protein
VAISTQWAKNMGAKKPRISEADWVEARNLYVQGTEGPTGERVYPTLENLAEKYGVNLVTVHRHSKADDWRGQRIVFQAKLKRETDAAKRKQLVEEAVDFDATSLKLAKALQADIVRLMRLANTERQRYEANLESWHERRTLALQNGEAFNEQAPNQPAIINSSGLNQLASALEKTHKTGRLALGESTENRNVSGTANNIESGLSEAFDLVRRLASGGESGLDGIH